MSASERELTAEWHNTVVNHVERRDLIISFAHNEEECVEKFGKFTDKIPIAADSHTQRWL